MNTTHQEESGPERIRRVAEIESAETFLAAAFVPANEERERLMSFVAHELRNPLASARWSVEMLARKPLGDGRHDRIAQLARRSVARLQNLIEDFLAFERIPRWPPHGQSDLRVAIDRALASRAPDSAGLDANVHVPSGLMIGLDEGLLARLLRACLRRVTHAQGNGPVELCATILDERVTLSMLRTGANRDEIDPPVLTSAGTDDYGISFAMLLARALAERLGVALRVLAVEGGVLLRLELPT